MADLSEFQVYPNDRYLGPSSDFGYRVCHGCEIGSERDIKHMDGCTMECIRVDCDWHDYIVPLVDKLD